MSNVSVYPNPNSGLVYVNLGELRNATINIYSSNGQVIQQQNGLSGFINLKSNSAPGLYFVEVKATEGVDVFKLIKK